MKRVLLCLLLISIGQQASCQTTTNDQILQSVDTTLKKIESNVKIIADNIKEEKKPQFEGNSIFEDTKGGSAIFLPYGGTFRLNTADASLKLSFIERISTKNFFTVLT